MRMICFMAEKTTLHELFPDAGEEKVDEIAELLHGYCDVVWRIYERLEREHPKVIDDLMRSRNMKAKVDSPKKTN